MIGQFNGLYFTVQPAKIKSLLTLNRHPPPQFEPGDEINIILTLFSLCLLLVMKFVFSAWSYACASCSGSKSKQKRIGWLLTVRTLNSVSKWYFKNVFNKMFTTFLFSFSGTSSTLHITKQQSPCRFYWRPSWCCQMLTSLCADVLLMMPMYLLFCEIMFNNCNTVHGKIMHFWLAENKVILI